MPRKTQQITPNQQRNRPLAIEIIYIIYHIFELFFMCFHELSYSYSHCPVMNLATISKPVTSSIFVGHSIVMLVVSCVVLHCTFDIVCTLETLDSVPLLGRAPHTVRDTLLLNFESGMMDNVTGSVFGYMPALLIATWAMRRSHDWLALRLLVIVASTAWTLIVSQIIVYFRIRHQVDSSTVALLVESSTPLAIVGLAAIFGVTGLFELCFAISNIVWPIDAGEIFSSLTGYHPSRLLSLGFSIPRSSWSGWRSCT
jgi:hypothetical protein